MQEILFLSYCTVFFNSSPTPLQHLIGLCGYGWIIFHQLAELKQFLKVCEIAIKPIANFEQI